MSNPDDPYRNRRAFGRSIRTFNAKRNADALKKMSRAERETGMTAEQLADRQRQMREDFLRRQSQREAA